MKVSVIHILTPDSSLFDVLGVPNPLCFDVLAIPIKSFSFYCSSSTTDKSSLAQRILELPKSYIYVSEKGKSCLLTVINLNQTKLYCPILSFSISVSSKAGDISVCHLCRHVSRTLEYQSKCGLVAWECINRVLCSTPQMALLLVVLVVPTLHIVRAGIDENIAFLLLGFGIILSDDRMEVVKIVTFYTWLLEGGKVTHFHNLREYFYK